MVYEVLYLFFVLAGCDGVGLGAYIECDQRGALVRYLPPPQVQDDNHPSSPPDYIHLDCGSVAARA